MAFKATLSVDGKTFNVLSCHYSFNQSVDATGRPSSDVRGGTASVTIESTDDNTIYNWMTDPHGFKDGKITFFKRDQDSKMKELEFKQAACINYSEAFDANSSSPMSLAFTLSAKEIVLGGDSHKNPWPI
jgi:hypothetical protein